MGGVGIFSDLGPVNRASELRSQHQDLNNLINKIYHNKIVEYGIRITDNYVRHFSPVFLFLEGDEIQRNKVPFMGQLYLFEIVTLILGLIGILYLRSNLNLNILLIWLVLAPLASALTFQSPHALRAQNMLIPLTMISALGVSVLFHTFKNLKVIGRLFSLIFAIILIWNVSYYLHSYYIHLPQMYPNSSPFGFKELVNFLNSVQHQYDHIIITTKYDQPYILTLFHQKYDPESFQNNHQLTPRDQFGFSTVNQFGKYKFEPITTNTFTRYENALVVGTSDEIPEDYVTTKVISFPNSSPAFKIVSI